MTYYLDVEIVKKECHPNTAKYFTRKDDPVADFELTELDKLDASLQQPKWDYYDKLEIKAAILHYGLVKNHPFHNGNKRVALVCLITFMFINDCEIAATDDELYKMTKYISESDRKDKDAVVEKITRWIAKKATPIESPETLV
jgi:death on curing protein